MGTVIKYGSLSDQEMVLDKLKKTLNLYSIENLNVQKIEITGDHVDEHLSHCFFVTDNFGRYKFWVYDDQLEYNFNSQNISSECLLEIEDYDYDYAAMEGDFFKRMENGLNSFSA